MRTVKSPDPTLPLKDRLSAKLALLLLGSFGAVLAVLMAWTMFTTIGDRQRATAETGVAAQVIVIDPKIQGDLAKALAFDAVPTAAAVQNPFLDRAGLSNTAVAAASSQSGSSTTSSGTTRGSSGGASVQIPATQGGVSVVSTASYDVKARYDEWLVRQRRGEQVESEAEILSIDDVVPVGFASGGDRPPEVLLYSLSLCRTFSFAAGTRLYDGYLNGFDQREVVFMFPDGLRRKSYSRVEPCKSSAPTGQP